MNFIKSIAPAGTLIVCLVAFCGGFQPAEAGSRGISLGIGGGLLLLDKLSKMPSGGQTSHRASRHSDDDPPARKRARRNRDDDDDGKPAKSAKKHRQHDDDDDDKPVKAAKKHPQNDDGDDGSKPVKAAKKPAQDDDENKPVAAKTDDAAKTGNDGARGTAAPAASAIPAATVTADPTIQSDAEFRAAQEHLNFLGFDPGAPNGTDERTKAAIQKFQASIHAPATGVLTVGQLKELFAKVAATSQASQAATPPAAGK